MAIINIVSNWKGISFIDTLYKFLTFRDLGIALFPSIERRKIKKYRQAQEKKIALSKNKKEISVLLFLQTEAVWKYDTLYWILEKSAHFKPIVVVSPYNVHLIYDKNECLNVMRRAIKFAQDKGYKYVSAYDFDRNKWLDVKKQFCPDIVFFSKPYKDTLPAYHIYNFKEALTLYTSYGFNTGGYYRETFNLPFYNLLWKYLLENNIYLQFSQQYSLCKGDNSVVIGSLGTEKLIDPNYKPKDVWKPQTIQGKKRIIWAPHHTVDYLFNLSTFMMYCDKMLEYAEKYKNLVQFAFKPHPVLKFKLINIWGKDKTEAYYEKWRSMENTQVEEGYYIDLFATSDAMIHDSISFKAEYLFTKKPVMLLYREDYTESELDVFGAQCVAAHYHGMSENDIESFIIDTVVNGNDPMKKDREQIFNNLLVSQDGILPSQKVFNLLCDTLNKN